MKKMLLCFCLSLLTFTGQALAADMQKIWEDGLTQLFQKKNMQMQSVEYSAENNTISIKGLSGNNVLAPDSTFNVGEIIITEPNPDFFTAKADEVPLVGKTVDLNNISATINVENAQQNVKPKADIQAKNIHLSQWKQNLVLLSNQNIEKNPEAYYKSVFNAFADSIVYNGINITITDKNPTTLQLEKLELKDVSPTKLASILLSNAAVNIAMRDKTTGATTQEKRIAFDSLESTDIGIPSAEHMAFLYSKAMEVLNGSASTEDIAKYNALSVAFNQQSPRWQFTLKGLLGEDINPEAKQKLFHFNEAQFLFFNDPETDAQLDISLKTLGSYINFNALGVPTTSMNETLLSLGTASSAFDFTFDTSIKTNKEYSTMTVSLADPKGPSAKLQVKVLLPEVKLSSILAFPFDQSMFMSLLMRSTFVEMSSESANITWQDPATKQVIASYDKENSRVVYDYNTGTKATLSQEIQNLAVDLSQIDGQATEAAMIKSAIGSSMLNISSKIGVDLFTNGSPSTFTYDIDIKDQAALNASLQFALPQKKISELVLAMDPNVTLTYLQQATILGAKSTFTEKGLLPRLLAFASAQTKQPAEALLTMLISQARENAKPIAHLLTPTSLDALESFLKAPKTLTVQASTTQPIALSPEALMLLGQPGVVSIDIQSETGADILTAGNQKEAPVSDEKKEAQAAVKPEEKAETMPEAEIKPAAKVESKEENTALVAPADKVAGKGIILENTQDIIGLTTFAPDQQPDSCVRVILSGISPLTAVRLESISGKIGSWKTKEVKNKAIGVLAVLKDGSIVNADDAPFNLDVLNATTLDLCAQDNGAIADEKTRLRVIFFHKDGSRKYSVIQR